jgi:hypothetical protein
VSLKDLKEARAIMKDIHENLVHLVKGFEELAARLSAIILEEQLEELKKAIHDEGSPD